MDFETLAVVGAAFFVAAFIKGITGLGFSTSAVAMLAVAIGVKATLPLLIIPALASNAMVMVKAGHCREMLVRFAWLYGLAILGVAIGLMLLAWVDGATAGGALGVVLLAYSLFSWRNPELNLPTRLERPLAPAVGLATGAINGLTGTQVMPLLPYLLALRLDPNRVVQASNISFSVSTLTMAVGLSQIGLLTPESTLISVLSLVPVYLGVKLGTAVRGRLSPTIFTKLVIVLLGISGLVLVVRLL